jgi:chromate transporter
MSVSSPDSFFGLKAAVLAVVIEAVLRVGRRALSAALSAVTAAVVGVILNLAVWFGLHVVFRQLLPWHNYGFTLDVPVLTSIDPFATMLAITAALALFRFKIGVIPTLLGCSLATY